ncbi:MAG TPA: CDP-diacylglycerol--glycerol-3-phosphate 3-phosphatidyltransferase [Nocardioides sp.]|uniref:CDP-diacylglycerol--glycerol-3-phosphate 3-phosphatidyltransferase n=1 Tax=Nocardioides sp. TaxID=35761 RepID=UPI002E33F572|nr:CDP-diacylglycerol--glycerol-3-phosphate 3-phosphatidyltransferase [Nocardioides sp.]HEX5090101.1 CDP-diacylglycerol--glycerol-3-phosphate 3-phosphatidyltransferase [Nocardioides sp.]
MNDDVAARPSNLNLPNVLTSLRIALVPFFAIALLMDGGTSIGWRLTAFAIFVGAMVTDKIDGDIARKRGLITDFGKIADPIADKAMTGMAFIGLAIIYDNPWWWAVTIIVELREWSVTLLRLSVLKKVVIAADQLGKVKTTFQAVGLSGLVLPLMDSDLPEWMQVPAEILWWIAMALVAVAVALTIISGVQFFLGVWRQRHLLRGAPAEGPAGPQSG